MKRKIYWFSAALLCLLLVCLPVYAQASQAVEQTNTVDGDVPVITIKKQKLEQLPQAQLLDAAAEETIMPQEKLRDGASYVCPYEGVYESKWFYGRKIDLPFYEYSRGSANGSDKESIYIYFLDRNGKVLASYRGAFESEAGYYSWTIEIEKSDLYMPDLYQVMFYSTYHSGNLESGAWPLYIQRKLPTNIGNTVKVDEAKANKNVALGFTSIDFTLVSNGYARQRYYVELCDAGKNVITSAEGEIDMKQGIYPCMLELSDTLRPGTYFMRCYTLDFPKLGEYVRFTVDHRGVGWEMDEEKGVLTFFGQGDIPYYSTFQAPWFNKMPDILENLKSIIIEPGITGIGMCAFQNYKGVNEISLPEGFREIGMSAFAGTGLQAVALPNSISTIHGGAFEGCDKLTEVTTFGGGHSDRGSLVSSAFGKCPNLKTVWIPSSIGTIQNSIFTDHGSLPMTIYFQDEAVSFLGSGFRGITATVYYPSNLDSWTSDKRMQYGGSITWTGYEAPLACVLMTGVNAHKTGNILYWTASTGADIYQVFRLRTGETEWELLCNTRSTAYKDTTAEIGVEYLYKVRAKNGERTSSLDIAGIRAKRAYPLESVMMSKAVGASDGIAVYWEAVEDAKLYQIYRLRSGDAQWTLLGQTGATGFKDLTAEHEVKYYYKVRARNGDLMSSLEIDSVFAERLCTIQNGPSYKHAWGTKEGNEFTWYGYGHQGIFEILRRKPDETTFLVIAETKKCEYLDTTAEPGVRYLYAVRARYGVAASKKSSWVGITRKFPLDSVNMTKILGHKTGNIVYWEAVDGADLYQVFRRAESESGWTLIKNTRSLAYKDESAALGIKYYYKVRARNGELMSSMDITALSAVRPYPLANVKMTKAVGHATGNIIYWEAVENAKLYQVYRRAADESGWTLIKNTGSLAYKDTEAQSGVKYYYKVVARNGDDCSSMDIPAVACVRP